MRAFYGKYRGYCHDNNDPKMRGRIRVTVPAVYGIGVPSNWAEPCFAADHFFVPEEGDGVWVEFEGGDPSLPVWSGVWFKGAGPTTEAPFQAVHPALTDYDGEEVDPDKRDHADPETVDDEEHREYHNHAGGQFYTPHRFGIRSHTGHTVELNDHPGRNAWVRVSDRFGRLLEMTAKGVTRLRSMALTAASGLWQDLEGADADAEHALEFSDLESESGEQYAELRDMAGARVRLNSTPGEEHILVADFWGQHLKINSKEGEESIELLDKEGNSVKLDVATSKITVTSAGDIHLDVATGGSLLVNGQPIATEAFVNNIFKTHIHPTSMGPSGTPVANPATNLWPQVSKDKT